MAPQGALLFSSPPFGGAGRAGVIDQDHPSLVDQRRGLERMPRLMAQEDLGNAPQFLVYERRQVIEGGCISVTPAFATDL